MATEVSPSVADELAGGPSATLGYGPREQADETRQAAQGVMNDVELDVNSNAVMCRSQNLTVDAMGKMFTSNMDYRDKISALALGKMAEKLTT